MFVLQREFLLSAKHALIPNLLKIQRYQRYLATTTLAKRPEVLLKSVGMYHSLHGTAGLQIPWVQL